MLCQSGIDGFAGNVIIVGKFNKNKYNSKNYDSLRIVVKKGKKAIISQYAQEQGKSINGLVNELLEDKIPQLKVLKENRTE